MYKIHHHSKQHGMATMAITLILLFIGTLVALYTAKTSIKEQQISANQYRAEQSLSTANAALDWGSAYYIESRGFACDERLVGVLDDYFDTCPPSEEDDKATLCTIKKADDTKCVFTYTKTNPLVIDPGLDDNADGADDALSIGASEMYYAFVDNGENCDAADGDTDGLCEYIPVNGDEGETVVDDYAGTNPPVYGAEIMIVGIGHSDDDTGKRIVSETLDTSNIFGDPGLGATAYPLISKAMNDPNASITIINRFDNRTIWTGTDLAGKGGSTNTWVLKDGLGWNCNDIKNHDNCVSSATAGDGGAPIYTMPATVPSTLDQSNINSDIIDGDTNLSNLDPDPDADPPTEEFFVNFFGRTKATMKELAKEEGLYVEAVDKNTLKYVNKLGKKVDIDWPGLADYTPLVWIDAPDGYEPSGGMEQLGTEVDPMILIVDGDLTIGGANLLVLVGALYVTGAWDASANLVVQGMVVVETNSKVQGGGTPTLIYDADLFSGKMGPPPGAVAGTVPGSWKDWE